MNLVPTQLGLIAAAAGSTSPATPSVPFLSGAKVKLVNSSSVTLNGSTQWGSVSAYIGGYDGYADGSLTFGAPAIPAGGGIIAESNAMNFRPTDATNPENMWGVVVTDSGGTNVLFAGPFDAPPIPMASSLNQITLVWQYNPAVCGGILQVIV